MSRLTAVVIGLALAACARAGTINLEQASEQLTIQRPALYPETLEYDRTHDRFLVGSFREGAIYQVDARGGVEKLVGDERLCSVLGIAVDAQRGRVWAVNSDLGACLKPSAAGPKHLAAVGIYDLSSGDALAYVDLAGIVPAGDHLLNGIALDASGNAYITDSLSPAIYKIDAAAKPSVFLQDQSFAGEGISLNGVVVHPDGYLLVVKKSDGSLFKVPLDQPAKFSRVAIDQRFLGGDGLLLSGKSDLIVIANKIPAAASNAAFALSSTDGWSSAQLRSSEQLGDVYPTTCALRGGEIYVLHSKLNELIQAPAEQKSQLREQATIRRIGKVAL